MSDRVRVTVGLPIVIADEIWIIHSFTDVGAALKRDQARRLIFYGDNVVTEGNRYGALVPQQPGDLPDLTILMDDRIRRVCIDASNVKDVLSDQRTLDALAKIAIDGINEFEKYHKYRFSPIRCIPMVICHSRYIVQHLMENL